MQENIKEMNGFVTYFQSLFPKRDLKRCVIFPRVRYHEKEEVSVVNVYSSLKCKSMCDKRDQIITRVHATILPS